MGEEKVLKLSDKMEALKDSRIEAIKADSMSLDPDKEELDSLVTIKYLGKMEFVNEKGELVEKDVFVSIEQIGTEFQIRYYDDEQKLLGVQKAIQGKMMFLPSEEYMWEKLPEKIKKAKQEDIEEAKTIEEVKREEQTNEAMKQIEKAKGPQLTLEQVNSLGGPKIPLAQPVDHDITLANKIGLEGEYIQFVDINDAKKLIPDLEIAELGQKFVPIEINKNGANVVSEDKMRFSTIKGSNSTERSITENNDGTRTLEQSIVTFEIPGTYNYISVGFNEQHMADPYYECKFQTIDRDSNRMGGEELLQSHVGPIMEDPEAHNERRINTEGQLKYTPEQVTEEQAIRYANAVGIFFEGTRKPDIAKAMEELKLEATGGETVEDVIAEAEENQLTLGTPKRTNN